MKPESGLMPIELIQSKIIVIRGERAMIDRDLAELYGVSTKALNQAATRNRKRFPPDFMFRLLSQEKEELVTNCDRFHTLKHSTVMPRAFTEQGVAMLCNKLSCYLNTEKRILIAMVENLWDKYAVSSRELEKGRSKTLDTLDEFLKGLG